MEIKFCRRCGAGVTKQREGFYKCDNGHELFYNNAGAAVGVLLVDEDDKVMLVTRAIDPDKGKLDAPGGFVNFGESLEEAIVREFKEELGLEPGEFGSPHYLCSGPNVYAYQGELQNPLDVFFWAHVPSGIKLKPQDDVADAKWYDLGTFNTQNIAFDTTRRALALLKHKMFSGELAREK